MSKTNSLFIFASVFSVFILALAIPSLYYAFDEENDSCQEGKRAGLTLSDWLKVTAFTDIGILGVMWIAAILAAAIGEDVGNGVMIGVCACGAIAKFVLLVIGIVVVSTNENNRCVSDGNPLGVMAIINLALFWLSSVGSGGSSSASR